MKKKAKLRFLLPALLLLVSVGAMAQDIKIVSFKKTSSVEASMNPQLDGLKKPCGMIRFLVRDSKKLRVESNLGVVKTVRGAGEVKVYVPQGRQKITLRCGNMIPLTNYMLPEEIEGKTTYEAVVELAGVGIEKERVVYVGAGFNALSIMGPSLAVGVSLNRHNIELGGVVGLNKSDDIFAYSSDGTLRSGHNYKAIRAQLRYGYELPLTDFFKLVPQVGVAGNFISGSKVKDVNGSDADYLKSASSVSALAALRLVAELNSHLHVQITPEYNFGLAKNDNCKTLSEYDSKIKSWTDGFNLNLGIMIYF